MFLKLSLGFFCIFSSLIAKDFGVAGKLFPIQEEDISKVFSEGLKEPSEKHKQAWRKKIEERVRRPLPVSGLKEAEKYRCLEFDPTLVIDEDILDDRGNVLARKGEKINPCTHQKREGGHLFFDGDIEEHIEWAESHARNFQWVLVNGSPIELEERAREEKNLERRVYFDQGGMYTKHFGIEKIPCRMTQKGDKLLLEEIPIKRRKKL